MSITANQKRAMDKYSPQMHEALSKILQLWQREDIKLPPSIGLQISKLLDRIEKSSSDMQGARMMSDKETELVNKAVGPSNTFLQK